MGERGGRMRRRQSAEDQDGEGKGKKGGEGIK